MRNVAASEELHRVDSIGRGILKRVQNNIIDQIACLHVFKDIDYLEIATDREWSNILLNSSRFLIRAPRRLTDVYNKMYWRVFSNLAYWHWPREKDDLPCDSFNSLEYLWAFCNLMAFLAFNSNKKHARKCYEYFWRAIPSPHMPLEDILQSVDISLVRKRFKFQEVNYTKQLKDVFGKVSDEFKPRSLQHLSRFAVRRQLESPGQISSLPLPNSIKSYLLLKS